MDCKTADQTEWFVEEAWSVISVESSEALSRWPGVEPKCQDDEDEIDSDDLFDDEDDDLFDDDDDLTDEFDDEEDYDDEFDDDELDDDDL